MNNTPTYLSDVFMPVYRFALVFAFLFAFASVLVGIGYGLFNYSTTELTFASSMYAGFIIFLKGASLSAVISFISFMAFWKKYQAAYDECKESKSNNCKEIGLFGLA